MYDDEQLELFKEQERNQFIVALWHYILALEDYVIRLRCRINHLHGSSKKPFPDPASDFILRSFGSYGYMEFSEVLECEELNWQIMD